MRHLAHLPNQPGFRFIGVKNDGSQVICRVVKNYTTGCHTTEVEDTGEANYHELAGWVDRAPHVCRCCGEETATGSDCCSDDFPEPGEMRETGR